MSEDTGGWSAGRSAAQGAITVVAWAWVGLPFLYGVVQLLAKIGPLFAG